ncbi:MAG: isocitrate/isopropylmalate dehydrogenase family protein [Gammaproteobacteria bacterium]|nr:isocitrate/isopropylmalate dehydrogenase family protein [Gammaproteobacteria bacterium]
MSKPCCDVAIIKGDGIGVEVTDATLEIIDLAVALQGGFEIVYQEFEAGAGYYLKQGIDIEPGAEEAVGECDAIFLGAIGLPSVRCEDGTEISPHLRLRERYQLYAGVRPVKAYANAPQRLSDPQAANIDLIILRESTEGLFYSAAVHGRSEVIENQEVRDCLRITRTTTEKLHRFAFRLAQKRMNAGHKGGLTCVDKANVFTSMAFFRQIFDETKSQFPEVPVGYNYVDAQALDLVRRPWEFDVMVMENMFGDILSDLAGGLVGGMGMAACAEIGDHIGLFQPAHGSAPDIMGNDLANPLAAILSGALMLDYLEDEKGLVGGASASTLIQAAVERGFEENRIRPKEFGGDMGTQAVTAEVLAQMNALTAGSL